MPKIIVKISCPEELIAIKRRGQEYILSLENAEMDRRDVKDAIPSHI